MNTNLKPALKALRLPGRVRRPVCLLLWVFLVGCEVGRAQKPAERSVVVPDGTAVKLHFFASPKSPAGYGPGHHAVLQVDEDVVVAGQVVVPKGSLALGYLDHIDSKPVHQKSFFASDRQNIIGKSILSYSVRLDWVFAADETQLAFQPDIISIDPQHGNGTKVAIGTQLSDVELTSPYEVVGKLKQATFLVR